MHFGGFEWDSGNLPKCLAHGVSLAEIEALFRGDVYIVRDSVGRSLSAMGRAVGFFVCSRGGATEFDRQRALHA